jgi:hypothetical protein
VAGGGHPAVVLTQAGCFWPLVTCSAQLLLHLWRVAWQQQPRSAGLQGNPVLACSMGGVEGAIPMRAVDFSDPTCTAASKWPSSLLAVAR